MKIFCLFIVLVATTGIAQAQKNVHKVFGTDEKIIRSSPKVVIYEIDQIPIMSIEQVQGENYIYDYRLIRSVSVNKKNALGLTSTVLDSTQYLYGVSKKCPFMGKYVLHFKNGKRSLTMIISTEPCDKAIIFCPGSVIDKKHIDLEENSSIVSTAIGLVLPKLDNKK